MNSASTGWVRRLAGACWRHRSLVVLSVLASVVGVGFVAVSPLLVKFVVDDAVAGSTDRLFWLIAALVGLALLSFGSAFLRRYLGGRLALDVQHDLRQAVFGAVQRLDGGNQDALRTGQVVSRSITDLQLVQGLLMMVPLSIGTVVFAVVALASMIWLSPVLTLVAFVVAPVVAWVAVRMRHTLFPATWSAQQRAADLAQHVEETVTGVRVVKGFGRETREVERLEDSARHLYAERMRAATLTARPAATLVAVPIAGQVAVLALGGYLALQGDVTLGTFLAFAGYVANLVGPTRLLAGLVVNAQLARAGVERVYELIDSQPDVTDSPTAHDVPDGPVGVELADVTFGYTRSEPVLNGVTLTVNPGETLALVGTAGSGKSTVSLLLPRFYDVHSGTVRVGGTDVRDLRLSSLRNAVGVVFEEAFLFSDTVANNIAYGRPDATPDDIRAAAKSAQAHDFIEALPQGYDTVVGERGLTLSGGQRQRVALARALLSNPRILILDDATSAVDPATESAIHETLRDVTADRTTLLIAHRRSTLSLADRIAVLDNGHLTALGTDAELRTTSPLYQALLSTPGDAIEDPTPHPDLTPGPDGTTPSLWPTPEDTLPTTPEAPVPSLTNPTPGGALPTHPNTNPAHPNTTRARHATYASNQPATNTSTQPTTDTPSEPNTPATPTTASPATTNTAAPESATRSTNLPSLADTTDSPPRQSTPTGHPTSPTDPNPTRESRTSSQPGPTQPPTPTAPPTPDTTREDHTARRKPAPQQSRTTPDHATPNRAAPNRAAPVRRTTRTSRATLNTTTPTAPPHPDDSDLVHVRAHTRRRPNTATTATPPAPTPRRTSRPGGGGGVADTVGALPPTPELLAAVEALPPATETPDLRGVDPTAPDPRFSLRRLLRPMRAPLAIVALMVIADALIAMAMPALIRIGVDDGVLTGNAATLWTVTAAAATLAAIAWVNTALTTILTARVGERMLYLLRVRSYAHLQRLGLDYYEREPAGRIMTRMTTDVDALSTFLQTGLASAVSGVLTVVAVTAGLILTDPSLALVALAILPPLALATVVFQRLSASAYTEARERVSAVNADMQENVSGLRVAQAFTREGQAARRFAERSDAYRRSRLRAQRYVATYFPFVALLADLAQAAVLVVGAQRVVDGSLEPGVLLAFMLYLGLFFAPVQQLSNVFDGYQQARVGLRRIGELLRTPTSVTPPAEPVAVPEHLVGEIELRDVTFAYPGNETPAIQDVSLRIRAGETVAFVGATGAGKSTVVKLLARFYDPTSGVVLVDGVDLRQIDLGAYRRRLGVVPQEAHLFTGDVARNVGYGDDLATRAGVEAAVRAVGALPMVASLSGGFRHEVGERGQGLSAGQRQLVALARAEFVDPDILLLDEATAALDSTTEAAVLAAGDRLSEGRGRRRTTIVVAHRLATAARADRIVVLDGGRVVEVGSHADLLAAGGRYARLWAHSSGVAVD